MNNKDKAIKLHDKKYNCCQAVACTFSDKVGIDDKTLFSISEGFGLGMGGADGVCGALSGAVMLAGIKNSDKNTDAPATKASTYKLSSCMIDKFKEKTGSIICKELKGTETGKPLCSCADCIRIAVEITEEVLDFRGE